MASIGSELITYLKTIPAITALVGSGSAARIYKRKIKQGVTVPFIRIEVFEGTSSETLTGISGIAVNRIQIDAYGADSEAAHTLAEAIRLAPLQMYRGTMGSTDVHGVTSPQTYRNGDDPPSKGSPSNRYYASRDYFITYSEATS